MDISLAKFQQLVAVARCGSISRAASDLNISQPALSRAIAAIEGWYGFAIFNRFGHGVEPTSAGLQVLEQAGPLLQGLHVFENNMRLLGGGKGGTLKMGMAPLLASQLAPRFAAEFFGPGSEAQLRVMVRPGADLLEALRSDEIELFIYPETHVDASEEIEVECIGHVTPICVVRRGHPLLDGAPFTMDEVRAYPWASSTEHPVGPNLPHAADLVCDNYHILRDAVLATDLVCICSTEFVARELSEGSLVALSVDELPMPATAIYAAKLKGRTGSPLAQAALARLALLLLA